MNDVIDICKVEGNIEIDGIEVNDKELDVVSLRERVGMVFQKPNPFPKSIYDNISVRETNYYNQYTSESESISL